LYIPGPSGRSFHGDPATMEALNDLEGILSGGLPEDPELAPLLARLEGNPFQGLREIFQDLQRNMPVGGRDLSLRNHSIQWAGIVI
jgi:hypothetical protein